MCLKTQLRLLETIATFQQEHLTSQQLYFSYTVVDFSRFPETGWTQ